MDRLIASANAMLLGVFECGNRQLISVIRSQRQQTERLQWRRQEGGSVARLTPTGTAPSPSVRLVPTRTRHGDLAP